MAVSLIAPIASSLIQSVASSLINVITRIKESGEQEKDKKLDFFHYPIDFFHYVLTEIRL